MPTRRLGGPAWIVELAAVIGFGMLGIVALYFLLTQQQVLLAVLSLLLTGVAGWRGVYKLLDKVNPGSDWNAFLAALASMGGSFVLYMGMLILAPMAGVVVDLYGVAPPMLLILQSAAFGFYAIHLGIVNTLGIRGTTMGRLFVGFPIFLVFSYSFVFGVALGGDWANAGEILGESGYAITSTARDVYEASTDTVVGVWNQMQPSRNRGTARLVCSWEMFAGGQLYAAGTGGAAIDKCVDRKVGANETQTPSEEVSEPVTVRIQDSWSEQIEPFVDHLRMEVPVTNTLVTDVQGRPIDIMARNVNLSLEWYYLNRRVAHVWKADADPSTDDVDPIELPNGDTRSFVFNKRPETGKFYFPIYSLLGDKTDNQVLTMLGKIKAACYQGKDVFSGKKNDCAWTQNATMKHVLEFDGPKPKMEDGNPVRKEELDLSIGRVAFLVKRTDDLTLEHLKASEEESDAFAKADGTTVDVAYLVRQEYGDDPTILAPGKQYRIQATVQYRYRAEAAFTEASRWSSTDNMLELWRQSPWQSKSFSDRQQWKREKCKGVTRYGQEITKQRTAALTTPIVPVMYADCGGSLFRRFTDDSNGDGIVDGTFNISLGATVNRRDQVDKEKGFTIHRVVTDCLNIGDTGQVTFWKLGQQDEKGTTISTDTDVSNQTNANDVSAAIVGSDKKYRPRFKEGVGWIISPGTMQVTVNVPGERRSIGCKMNMGFTVNLGTETTYETPSFDELG